MARKLRVEYAGAIPVLGLTTGAAVSLQMKRAEAARNEDRAIARKMDRIERA